MSIVLNINANAKHNVQPEGSQNTGVPRESLSAREWEVCQLLLEGLAVKEVAARCSVAHRTAECHTRNLYRKLGVSTRVELIKHFVAEPVVEVREAPKDSDHVQILQRLELIEESLRQIAMHLRSPGPKTLVSLDVA